MKVFKNCPKCYKELVFNKNLEVECINSNHRLYFTYNNGEIYYIFIDIIILPRYVALFGLKQKFCTIAKYNTNSRYYPIPYFEPDLSDYDKLINKLKTYILYL